MVDPIFILSLPRSGSTMAQRLIATHPDVSTAAEPWVLLPFLYSMRTEGVLAEYDHQVSSLAVSEFAQTLPGGLEDFRKELSEFIIRLYGRAADPDAKYFLDKTPRYHHIVDELVKLFPSGKFVFLWRNPLSVLASVIDGLGSRDRWNVFAYETDLTQGLIRLVRAHEANERSTLAIRYEDLCSNTADVLDRIFAYLEIDVPGDIEQRFPSTNLVGSMGDKTGSQEYDRVTTASIEKWKRVLNRPMRRRFAQRYLEEIPPDVLETMGYARTNLMSELENLDLVWDQTPSDIVRMLYGKIVHPIRTRVA